MSAQKYSPRVFPICQNVLCSKNSLSDRIFWKRELDHQYRFYLATLRAERDARYVIQEHSDILRRIESEEAQNVELRKEIRLLEMELYTMCQRNAHDSCIIDGLHMADHEIGEFELLESETRQREDMTTAKGKQEDSLIEVLKNEVTLLQKKTREDEKLIVSFRPLEQQLKKTLEMEKLKNHQEAMKFKRDLEDILNEFQQRNSNFETIKSEKSSEIIWASEIFSSIFGDNINSIQDISTTDDAVSNDSSLETESFDISSQEDIPDVTGLGDDFQALKDEYCEFVALKELLDEKNVVNVSLVYDCLKRFSKGVEVLADEYLSVYEITTDIEFIKEYMERLNDMRKKKDIVQKDPDPLQTAQRLDQLNIIFTTLLAEKTFLLKMLHHFMTTLKEDFEAHFVILHKTEELFASPPTE